MNRRLVIRLVPCLVAASVLLSACPTKEQQDALDAETTVPTVLETVLETVPETAPDTVAETVPDTTVPAVTCNPLPVSGVTDLLVSDAEAFANSLGASAVANWEITTYGLQCAFESSGISGLVAPGDPAGPGNLSATGAPLDAGADGVMPFAVLDTAGNCALRAIVESGGGVKLYIVTAQAVTCNAYEALDGYTAGQFVPA
ncbi:MAG: hypothetical protein ABMA25_24875 [Ilumatobacteraceae bacterium]